MTTELFTPKSWKPRTREERALAFVVRTLGELSTDGLPDEVELAIRRSYERANAALVAMLALNTERKP